MKHKKIQIFAIILVLIIFYKPDIVMASSITEDIVNSQAASIDFSELNTVIGNKQKAYSIDFTDLFTKAITGNLDFSFSAIFGGLMKMIFSEFYANTSMLRDLIIIAIASAVLKNLTDSFKNKSVGEMGFYISYIAMVLILFSSFKMAAGILEDLVYTVTDFINAGVPLFVSLLIMSGNFTGGYVFNTILVFATNLVVKLVNGVISPAIIIIATLQIVNYLTENDTLTNFSKLLKNSITWVLRITAMGIVSLISIQKISTPILNNIALKTTKSAINVVPVVGEILSGAVDSVMYWGSACKSGVLIVVIITMVSICFVPIIKLCVLMGVYKLTAALIQPICDKRIVDCINAIGDYTALLLSAGCVISLMFLISSMIILSF